MSERWRDGYDRWECHNPDDDGPDCAECGSGDGDLDDHGHFVCNDCAKYAWTCQQCGRNGIDCTEYTKKLCEDCFDKCGEGSE